MGSVVLVVCTAYLLPCRVSIGLCWQEGDGGVMMVESGAAGQL